MLSEKHEYAVVLFTEEEQSVAIIHKSGKTNVDVRSFISRTYYMSYHMDCKFCQIVCIQGVYI